MTLTIINREQVWTVAGALLLVSCLQLFCGSQLYGQQPDMDAAAAAKAAAGLEALTHGPIDSPGPKAVGTFITFDVPGAATGRNQGTFPTAINPDGAIAGYYYDVNFVGRGFVRASNGAFTTFEVPGAVGGIFPASINPDGAIAGYYYDVNFVGRGFVRASNGILTTFDAPGAVIGMIGTFPSGINPAGAITGYFYDPNFVSHGFLRARNGTLTTFDAPGAGTTGEFPGTYAVGINPEGTIAGMYTDANNATHGLLRASNGSFTTFDPPGSIAIFNAFSFGLNLYIKPDGVIAGNLL